MTSPQSLALAASRDLNMKIEQHIRLCIQPRPRWLPWFIWRAILRRVVVLEMTAPTFTTERKP